MLMYNGSVACAGGNTYGQLGTGKTWYDDPLTPRSGPFAPATVLSGIKVTSVGAGYDVTCVLAAPSQGNRVECFGDNQFGKLGHGENISMSTVPVAVQGLKQSLPIIQLVVSDINACVLYAKDGTTGSSSVQCWALNSAKVWKQCLKPQTFLVWTQL
jgi:hypothetical protein